jgi:hypothetical protein
MKRLRSLWHKLNDYTEETKEEIIKSMKFMEMYTFIKNVKLEEYDYDCIEKVYNMLKK